TAGAPPPRAVVVAPRIIPLAGPLEDPAAEVSGMTWHGDTLVILPQDPDLFAPGDTLGFFTLAGTGIRAWLDGGGGVLEPRLVPCVAPGLARIVRGFDGLEATGMIGNRCYLTVEAKQDTVMAGYLVCGEYDLRQGMVFMDMTRLTAIPLGINIFNVAEEALVIDGRRVITMSEANGANVNPEPRAKVFAEDLDYLGSLPFPQIEYRVTDATALDARRRFWVINYFYPPDAARLFPAPDPEVARHGAPDWLTPTTCIERLLELELTPDDRIVRTDTPPIWLQPRTDGQCRNWEALVRLDDRGFLLMTDKYPGTLLAFVPLPDLD
ncbi:MAG: hypothetical protein IH621_10950, partial [Krumholzibacteria bacterium]|nr:hypothetical protein [Candidatus Krumholzibacteria bacterium]